MAASSSDTDVVVMRQGTETILTTIGHSHVMVTIGGRGVFHIDTAFFLGDLRFPGGSPFPQPEPVEKRRRRRGHNDHFGYKPRVIFTEQKTNTKKKPLLHKRTNCQKRQIYGAVRTK